ncbi:MAG TPA: hypothetical protein DCY55_11985 [Gammaproteobacteria bacterium]|jgi:MSHA biogenesis protein MshO|nr:hypothetical protein [Gammaproteobacteria bacterium]
MPLYSQLEHQMLPVAVNRRQRIETLSHGFRSRIRARGLTLIELIVSILLLSIVAGGSIAYVISSTQTYYQTAVRGQLSGIGRTAIGQLERAINNAVPNSFRIRSSASLDEQCLEFLPIVSASYYTSAPFVDPGTTVDAIYLSQTSGGNYAVIYPLSAADLYQKSNPGPLGDISAITAQTITLASSHTFTSMSPGSRVYYAGEPVSYCLSGNQLFRYRNQTSVGAGYSLRTSQCLPSDSNCLPMGPPDRALIADSIDNASESLSVFEFETAGLANAGLIRLNLKFSDGLESMIVRHEIQVKNVQ